MGRHTSISAPSPHGCPGMLLQPCARSLARSLILTMLGVVLVEAVPTTRAPGGGGRRRTTTSPTPPVCVDSPTTAVPTSPLDPAGPAGPAGPPTTSLAATNTTWPRWVGPVGPVGMPPPPPPRNAAPTQATAPDGAPGDNDAVTCYTCVNVSDNIICNQYAIDAPCPKGEDFCHTLHIVDSRGQSVLVNKKCAEASECDPAVLGCLHIDTQTVCASCCDESYCNETVPTNRTASFYSSTRTTTSTAATAGSAAPGKARQDSVAATAAAAVSLWVAATFVRAAAC